MARTRDVLLVLLCLGFVFVVGVGQFGRFLSNAATTTETLSDTPVVETSGVETVIREDRRAERLAQWQERLKDFTPAAVIMPEIIEVVSTGASTTVNEVSRCLDYRPFTEVVPRLYSFEAEGVRVFSSSEQNEFIDGVVTFAVVPIRAGQGANGQYCLSTDVIGIATNGTLIRNNQVTGYGIFEAGTLVGYALDGFPIYGRLADTELDTCGGRMTTSGYQYQIGGERTDILRCFVAPPVAIL